jgi:hypothetical protein
VLRRGERWPAWDLVKCEKGEENSDFLPKGYKEVERQATLAEREDQIKTLETRIEEIRQSEKTKGKKIIKRLINKE